MTTDPAVYAMLLIAAITPGPNNVIVLRAVTTGGLPRVLPAIAGIVLGGLAMLGVAVVGLGGVLAGRPDVLRVLAIAGGGYLTWLGLASVRHAGAAVSPAGAGLHTMTAPALFGFQFVNPKAWVMLATAATGAHGSLAALALAFAVIATAALMAWAALGAVLARVLVRPRIAIWVDRALGALLALSGVALIGGA